MNNKLEQENGNWKDGFKKCRVIAVTYHYDKKMNKDNIIIILDRYGIISIQYQKELRIWPARFRSKRAAMHIKLEDELFFV